MNSKEEVESLIFNLKKMREERSSLLSQISDFDLVITGLRELNEMIEMDEVKKSIISQIKFLLINSLNSTGENFDGHMVHTVLSGVPGVGKTATGVILAKIWTGLGLLSKSSPRIDFDTSSSEEVEENDRIMELQNQINNLRITGKMKNGVVKRLQSYIANIKEQIKSSNPEISLNTYHLKTLKRELESRPEIIYRSWINTINDIIKINDDLKSTNENILMNTIPDEIVSFSIVISSPNSRENSGSLTNINDGIEKLKDMTKKLRIRSKSLSEPSLRKSPEKKVDTEMIRIVSREDFVGGYLGQSALKTESLLRESLGKVLFIDEAYSLVNDEKDSYGKEALTVLNRFMSEHSNELIVIFAGYKDLMEQTIFKFQPGLRRRCSWNFEIKGYTENGLAKIFETQLRKNGWELEEDIDLVSFFQEHIDDFPSFGGDTLRLSFYCKICYSNYVFDEKQPNTKLINSEMLDCAFKQFKTHKISNKEEDKMHHLHMYA